jgi:thiol-disulfide isomerase/thioredoxin
MYLNTLNGIVKRQGKTCRFFYETTMEKHVLIFSASWCGPCNQMKYYVWQNKNVQKALSKFDSVQKIDMFDEIAEVSTGWRSTKFILSND